MKTFPMFQNLSSRKGYVYCLKPRCKKRKRYTYVLVVKVYAGGKNLGRSAWVTQVCTTADNFENWVEGQIDPDFENNNFSMVRRDYQESTIVP